MAFDVYPDPQDVLLALQRGVPSELISIAERAAIDPVTGSNTMNVAVVKLGAGCSAPGPPPPVLRLKVGTGPLTTIGNNTALVAEPGAADPVAIATATQRDSPEMALLEIEVLQPGQVWQLQIEHSGPSDSHDFTWVVADNAAEARQPWLDAPRSVEFAVNVGEVLRQSVAVANRGTGTLVLTDVAGTALQAGFALEAIAPSSVPPNGCATATVSFTAPASPGVRDGEYSIMSNDGAAGTDVGHNKLVRLKATVSQPVPPTPPKLHLIAIRCIVQIEPPWDEIRGITGIGPGLTQLTDIRQVLPSTRLQNGETATIEQHVPFTEKVYVDFFMAVFDGDRMGPGQVNKSLRGAGVQFVTLTTGHPGSPVYELTYEVV